MRLPPLHFLPDKKLMALITNGDSIRLVDPQTGVEYVRLEDPSQDRGLVRFSSDATQIVTNNDDPSVHVWDLRPFGLSSSNLTSTGNCLLLRRRQPGANVSRGEFRWTLAPLGAMRAECRSALARYTLAMELQPFNAEGFYQRALAHGFLEQWPQALVDCNKSLLMGPQRLEAHYLRGQILQRLGRPWERFPSLARQSSWNRPGFQRRKSCKKTWPPISMMPRHATISRGTS